MDIEVEVKVAETESSKGADFEHYATVALVKSYMGESAAGDLT